MAERLIGTAPDKVLTLLGENYGRAVSGDEISKVVWGENHRMSNQYIASLVKRCRSYIENESYVKRRFGEKNPALYSISNYSRFLLSDRLEMGSWISLPRECDSRIDMLLIEDIDYIHQCEVRSKFRLVSRLTPREYHFLSVLCDLTEKSGGGYVDSKKIAAACFGFDDSSELHSVLVNVSRLRYKLNGSTSIQLESEQGYGYRIIPNKPEFSY